jgi:hypothetical protein
MSALTKIKNAGFSIKLVGDKLSIIPASKLTPEQREFIKSHKLEIIGELKHAANDEVNHRYAYRYEFKNGEGAGTWITSTPPDKARDFFLLQFPSKELEFITLIN